MRKVILIASLAAITAVGASAADSGRRLTATLEGENQVPTAGDPDGTGTASVRINPGTGQVCYSITVSKIGPAQAGHIHSGAAGTNGPVVVDLMAPTSGSSSGCTTADRSLALEMVRNPAGFYVNVHNAEYPNGAIRGQLGK